MTQPVARTTIVSDTIALLYSQFQGDPVLSAIVAAFAVEMQEIETMLVDVWVNCVLANAENEQLDVVGRVLLEGRRGRSDTDYRAALYAQVLLLHSSGQVNEILAVLEAFQAGTYHLVDYELASITVRFVGAIGSVDYDLLNDVLQKAKAGGVRADFIYSEEDDSDTFTCADADAIQTDANTGCANDAGTVGGSLAEVVI